jgi:hypothetical protein
VYETLPVARADFGAVGEADELGVAVVAEFAIELLCGVYDEGLEGITCLGLR